MELDISTTSEHTHPSIVLQPSSTPTQPSVPIVPVQQHRERQSKGRVAAIDLRIGLNMLGIEGRKLLAEYITIKRQRLTDKSS